MAESPVLVPPDKETFLILLIRELAVVLEDVVGFHEASGYLSLVGQNIGERINDAYKAKFGSHRLTRTQIADVLADFTSQIGGAFSVCEQSDEKIVLESRCCPFGEQVIDKALICMMTTNILGLIASENLGYAKVALVRTIAKRDGYCRIVIFLKTGAEADAEAGREYFGPKI